MTGAIRFILSSFLVHSALVEGNLRGSESDEPRCLSFITKARLFCAPIEEFIAKRGYNSQANELTSKNIVEKPISSQINTLSKIRPTSTEEITWSNLVLIMIIHNSPKVDALIEAHFKTWLRRVGEGLDVVFVTDKEDPRELSDLVPEGASKAKFELYKSDAQFDGKHIRFKVIDAYDHVAKTFQNDLSKKYFFKMDTDTYLLGDNLLDYLSRLDSVAGSIPLHIGRLMCSHTEVCHTGGAFYGMNRQGFEATNKYFEDNPDITTHEQLIHYVKRGKSSSQNLMHHEDFMVSYAFRKATNIPALHQHEFYQNVYETNGISTTDSPPITYHMCKLPELIIAHEEFFYGKNSTPETPLRSYAELEYSLEHDGRKMKWMQPYGWIIVE